MPVWLSCSALASPYLVLPGSALSARSTYVFYVYPSYATSTSMASAAIAKVRRPWADTAPAKVVLGCLPATTDEPQSLA